MIPDIEVGIDALAIHIPKLYVDQRELAEKRGIDPDKFIKGLGQGKMSVPDANEDAVSMAANAAQKLFQNDVSPDDIGKLVVGTESGVDASKPIAAYLHGLLGLHSTVEAYDLKHACIGGTYGLLDVINWINAEQNYGKNALVVCTDISRYPFTSTQEPTGEPTQGAGAVAFVVKKFARLAIFDTIHGTFSKDVPDFWRPARSDVAFVKDKGKFSLECYLEALDKSYKDYLHKGGSRKFDYYVFHTPFAKMARKAMAQMLSFEYNEAIDCNDPRVKPFVEPSLTAARQVGNIYTGSVFLALASLLETNDRKGTRAGLYSYGSGCSAKFLRLDIPEYTVNLGLKDLLENRQKISVEQYEALRRGEIKEPIAKRDGFFLEKIDEQGYRHYSKA